MTESGADFKARLHSVRKRIAAAARRVDRDPDEVHLMPVSKTVPANRMRLAAAAGIAEFGENKVQEAYRKWQELSDLDLRWCVIGNLQTNKAKYVARFASEFHALDRIRAAEALERRLQLEGRSLDVFVQVNTSGEASKYGVAPKNLPKLLKDLAAFETLNVRGLMTLAIFSADTNRVRSCFQLLRQLRNQAQQDAVHPNLRELSMGMSADFELAIEEGATTVRIGQEIFGPRPLPDSHYWPH